MYKELGIKKEIWELSKQVEKDVEAQFEKIEKIKEINSLKVLSAFQKCNLLENVRIGKELTARLFQPSNACRSPQYLLPSIHR